MPEGQRQREPESSEVDDFESRLQVVLAGRLGPEARLQSAERLSGGASAETWTLVVEGVAGVDRLILRRSRVESSSTRVTKEMEARIQDEAFAANVPVARVHFVLEESDGLGSGYAMEWIEGETIARRILRDERYSTARSRLARQCGEVACRIHGLYRERLPSLQVLDPASQVASYRSSYERHDDPHPVFDWAFRWLEERLPTDRPVGLVHGDFRHGNFIVDELGLAAVLDWELAHFGDPMEDLGWVCVRSWRFGVNENPVGGFGEREDLYAGYESAGGTVDRDAARFWEVFGCLKWGVMCMTQAFSHLDGHLRSLEKAAIGRRASETEIDLLLLLLEGN